MLQSMHVSSLHLFLSLHFCFLILPAEPLSVLLLRSESPLIGCQTVIQSHNYHHYQMEFTYESLSLYPYLSSALFLCVRVCMCACMRACLHACLRACVWLPSPGIHEVLQECGDKAEAVSVRRPICPLFCLSCSHTCSGSHAKKFARSAGLSF